MFVFAEEKHMTRNGPCFIFVQQFVLHVYISKVSTREFRFTFTVDYKSWFDYVRDWCKVLEENKDYPIHVINYEDMHTVYTLLYKFMVHACEFFRFFIIIIQLNMSNTEKSLLALKGFFNMAQWD